jgi:glycosyltransferase involved in cell wall biosynthesis
MSLIYISQGNIPSKWAHTFQAMKMAEAFGRLVSDFRLLTQIHWMGLFRRRFDYESWYGIRHRFRIVRLPVRSTPRGSVFEKVRYPDFDRAAVRYVFRQQPDRVFTRSEPTAEALTAIGLPAVLETHVYRGHPLFEKVCAMAARPSLIGVVTISEVLRKQLTDAGVPAEKVLVLPDAVDVEAFQALPSKVELRRRLGLPEDARIATYSGHLYANRGVEEIIAAARLMPHVLFLFVGGWEKDVEERKAQTRELANVRFTGFVFNRDVPAYLVASDALLMPYTRQCETAEWMSPLKLFEYMASGTPIIASDLPALCVHLVSGRNALLVPDGDAGAIAKALGLILDGVGAQLGRNATQEVSGLTWINRASAVIAQWGSLCHPP